MSRGWGRTQRELYCTLMDDADKPLTFGELIRAAYPAAFKPGFVLRRSIKRSTSWWRKATSMRSAKVAGLTRTAIAWRRLHRGLRRGTATSLCGGKHAKLTDGGWAIQHCPSIHSQP